MYNWSKALFVGVLVFIGFNACSSSKSTVSSGSDGMGPAWYVSSGFSSDSLSFHGYATAIASDSVIAVANAELQARAELETAFAQKLEDVREAMEEEGASEATEPAFIIALRNAHQPVEDRSDATAGKATSEGEYYRGFAQVSITRADFLRLLEDGFRGNNTYWQALSGSPAFAVEFK